MRAVPDQQSEIDEAIRIAQANAAEVCQLSLVASDEADLERRLADRFDLSDVQARTISCLPFRMLTERHRTVRA